MKRLLIVSDDLHDFIRHLPPELKKKIRQAITNIVQDPESGKALAEELKGLRSYRVGRMRVIYHLEGNGVHLITIGPRKTVYQKAALEIKRQLQGKSG